MRNPATGSDGSAHPPSVDALARSLVDTGLPHPLLVHAARQAVAGGDGDGVEERARAAAVAWSRRLLGPVVNATGVLLHTNLGRAPVAHHRDPTYLDLELDLETGRRGSRSSHCAALLALACGADDALVVNNGAAAVLLALAALADGRGVAVSRGEEVEIGGGFRIPEVLERSGARLVEVGTTNRTRTDDYRQAVDAGDVAVLLKVHRSNYRIVGFTEEAPVGELAQVGPPVVVDLGSGLLDEACPWLRGGPPAWLAGEPGVRQTLEAGARLVTFSGDKLLGGPQAGILAGDAELVAACARHPLARALRPGSLVLDALQDTVLAHLRRDVDDLPLWRLATTPTEDLRRRAGDVVAAVEAVGHGAPRCSVATTAAVPGGGTLPGAEIPSAGVTVGGDITEALRAATPPVIARVEDGTTVCDLRTVLPGQDDDLVRALVAARPRS